MFARSYGGGGGGGGGEKGVEAADEKKKRRVDSHPSTSSMKEAHESWHRLEGKIPHPLSVRQ